MEKRQTSAAKLEKRRAKEYPYVEPTTTVANRALLGIRGTRRYYRNCRRKNASTTGSQVTEYSTLTRFTATSAESTKVTTHVLMENGYRCRRSPYFKGALWIGIVPLLRSRKAHFFMLILIQRMSQTSTKNTYVK